MALGKRRRERRLEPFVAASNLPKSPGHPFHKALNQLLAANGYDARVEKLCAPYDAETMGRPGLPPGVFEAEIPNSVNASSVPSGSPGGRTAEIVGRSVQSDRHAAVGVQR